MRPPLSYGVGQRDPSSILPATGCSEESPSLRGSRRGGMIRVNLKAEALDVMFAG